MSFELLLISKILEDQSVLTPLIKYNILPDNLKHPLAKTIYEFILKYRLSYGNIPSRELIENKFRDFKFTTSPDSIEAICEHIIDTNFTNEFHITLKKLVDIGEEDPRKALYFMEQSCTSLRKKWKISPKDIELSKYLPNIKDIYQRYKEKKGTIGIPYPWDILNKETGGMNPQDLIVFYGAAKSCKSWLLIYIATYLYAEKHKRILFITKEMSPENVAFRAIAIICKLPYGSFKRGELTSEQEARIFDTMQTLNNSGNFIISDGRVETSSSVSVASIAVKIDEHAPEIVFIDGSYLMEDSRTKQKTIDYKNITHITQDLKELAQIKNIPIVITTQTNRWGDSSYKHEDIAFSTSYIQDCDALFRIFRNKRSNELAILTRALREGEEKGFVINCKIANDFSLKYPYIKNLKEFIKADKEGSSSLYLEEISGNGTNFSDLEDINQEDILSDPFASLRK